MDVMSDITYFVDKQTQTCINSGASKWFVKWSGSNSERWKKLINVHVHGKFSDISDTYFTKHSFTRNRHGFGFPSTTEFESCFLNEYSTKLADTVTISIRKYDSQNNICKVFRFELKRCFLRERSIVKTSTVL